MTSLFDRMLRRLASLLVRGPEASHILDDLEEAMGRDLARGLSRSRTRWRYFANASASAGILAIARLGSFRRGLSPIQVSLLDLKLGVRMLFKYPGLTAVAVFALALGIPAALWPFHLLNIFDATLPFEDGERIVGLRHHYIERFEEADGSFHEYVVWRDALTSFDVIGAAQSQRLNVVSEEGRAEPWNGARMSASSFAVVRVSPIYGRPLTSADERPGSPDVVVLGYQLWQSYFAGNPSAIGRSIRIGGIPHLVVGVMPEGFLFPVNNQLWLPLRTDPLGAAPGQGPDLLIYGRLSAGSSQRRALAEMTGVERGLDEAFPEVYGRLRPQIVGFSYLFAGSSDEIRWILAPFQLLALVLLAVACGNVGTMILARTAARSGEVAVRTALRASRARIVSQLFVETLMLALLATGVGLALAEWAARQFSRGIDTVWSGAEALPFWFDPTPSAKTVAQALGLAVFSAAVAGVLPALKATGRSIQGNLQRAGVGRSGIRFGRGTTALIVAEVALGVVCLFVCVQGYRMFPQFYVPPSEIRTEQFLSARLRSTDQEFAHIGEEEPGERLARVESVNSELLRRLTAEPGVRGVALTSVLPGEPHPAVRIELEGASSPADSAGHWVKRATVGLGFFDGLGAPVRMGRSFAVSDLPMQEGEASAVIIVNTPFVERILHGTNPIGRRVRYLRGDARVPGPWLEIVGVVGDLGMVDQSMRADAGAGLYHPTATVAFDPAKIAIHVGGEPLDFVPRLRAILAEIDPSAVVEGTVPLSEIMSGGRFLMGWLLFGVGVIAGVAMVLSIASLYALMSFTVSQRLHEIGVRTALGAASSDIMAVIARRAVFQLTAGIGIAVAACGLFLGAFTRYNATLGGGLLSLALAVGIVLLVGLAACIVPTRRGLKIRPIDAMRV